MRGLLANLRYWQAQTAVINDDIIRDLDPDFPNVLQAVEMGLVLAETWRETAVLILQCFFWVEGSGRVPQWRPLLEKCLAVRSAPDEWLEFRLLKQLGQIQRLQWQLPTAVATFQQAGTLAQGLQDNQAIAEIHMNLCQTYQSQHQYDKAEAEGTQALALFTEAQPRLKAITLQSLGHIAREQGHYDLAETRFQQALALTHSSHTPSITDAIRTMNGLASMYQEQKQYERAERLYQETVDLLANTTKAEDKIRAALNQGSLYYDWQKFDQAQAVFRQAEHMLAQQKGMIWLKGIVTNDLGCVLRHQQEWSMAERYLQESITLFQQAEDDLMLANTVGNLADLYLDQGAREQALSRFDEAIQLAARFPQNNWAKSQIADYTEKIRGLGRTEQKG
ncbi:MAG TPA: tetratricopeptide repeat protein [Chloroflexota bacterium]|nr:tetratricopeptide repeat protein [Chloroflexota bacterium]